MAFWSRFFGGAGSTAAGIAIGATAVPALAPAAQEIVNEAWSLHPNKPPDAFTLAEGVAQGQVDEATAREWAHATGYSDTAFTALIDIANVGPGLAQAYRMWRRGQIGEDGFRRAVKRSGLEGEWIDDLAQLKEEVLDPADLARGIHRGLVPDPGLLKGELPTGVGNVPAYPVYPIDALKEAAAAGFDHDHLGVLVGLQGLPMGSHEAAQALFRGVLEENDYLRAIAEGNTRNEWADAIKEQSRAIPSVTNYVEGRVRGWLTDAEMNAGTARHGMTPEDTHLEFLIHGRPLSWHQVFIGLRRGGKYDGATGDLDPAFLKALEESNIRPEWYALAWAQRYSYPSAFILRSLTESGDITAAEAHEILLFEGWEPTLAAKVSAKWGENAGTAGGVKPNPWVDKANTQLWTATHKAYKGGGTDAAGARQRFDLIGVPAEAQDAVLARWDSEKAL